MTDDNTTISVLDTWRLNWTANELVWRTGWQALADDARQERERAKIARRANDRQTFGTDWAAQPEKRKAILRRDRLQGFGLPIFESEGDLAAWLGIELTRLRWFTHDQQVETVWHYTRVEIPKRRGGTRVILAPKTELKALQRKILTDLLARLPIHPAAHGFIPDRSIVTNAALHVGRQFVLNMDLADFFPSVGVRRVRGLFIGLGYSWSLASVLALLCTERDRATLVRNGKPIWVSTGDRVLVQGAPTSPALSNLIARRLDARLSGLARRLDLTYTRYADDLTFSGDDLRAILAARHWAHRIVEDEGFRVNREKTHLYRRSNRQMVTGLVVNDQVHVPRDARRTLRAILHQAQTTGLDGQNRQHIPNFRAHLQGLIAYLAMTSPEQAQQFKLMLESLKD